MRIPTLILLAITLLLSIPVQGETITALPFTCTHPGNYTLGGNLTFNKPKNAITIAASFVTLDLKGNSLISTGTSSVAIYGTDAANVTIRNGTVRGFKNGIYLTGTGSTNALVEDLRILGSDSTAIEIDSDYAVIRNNFIADTGDGTSFVWAILHNANAGKITGNDIINTLGTSSRGIQAYDADVENNRICGNTRISIGIVVFSGNQNVRNAIVNNRVDNCTIGIDLANSTLGVYRDNIVQNCTTAYSGGTNGGGNTP